MCVGRTVTAGRFFLWCAYVEAGAVGQSDIEEQAGPMAQVGEGPHRLLHAGCDIWSGRRHVARASLNAHLPKDLLPAR